MPVRPAAAVRTALHTTVLLVPAFAATGVSAQSIVLDGTFDDWATVAVAATDPFGDAAPAAELDLGTIRVAHDEGFVHLLLELTPTTGPFVKPLRNLQKLEGDLLLVLDADGDEATGTTSHGLAGADVEVVMTAGSGNRRQGFAVREAGSTGGGFSPDALGVVAAPTVAAPQVEIRLERGRRLPGTGPLLAAGAIRGRFVHRAADGAVLDDTEIFSVTLGTPARADTLVGTAALPPRTDGTIRAVSWNIERGGLRERSELVGRLVAAVDADVLLLQELTDDFTDEEVVSILTTATGDAWAAQVGTSGGSLRSAVAVRNRAGDARQARRVPELEPLPSEGGRGVRTSALGVQHEGRWILFLSVHLKCCGSIGDRSDRTRVDEMNTIRRGIAARIGADWSRGEVPYRGLVIAGDYNLVGSVDPLTTLLRGGDRDGSDLVAVEARQLDDRSTITWQKPGQPFAPGRLDYVVIGDRDLTARRAFVLDTTDLAASALTAVRLDEGATEDASDHLPVVVDLDWR